MEFTTTSTSGMGRIPSKRVALSATPALCTPRAGHEAQDEPLEPARRLFAHSRGWQGTARRARSTRASRRRQRSPGPQPRSPARPGWQARGWSVGHPSRRSADPVGCGACRDPTRGTRDGPEGPHSMGLSQPRPGPVCTTSGRLAPPTRLCRPRPAPAAGSGPRCHPGRTGRGASTSVCHGSNSFLAHPATHTRCDTGT